MAQIPTVVSQELVSGLNLFSQGKVRDTYNLPGHPDNLLPVASDRISIFDFVLPALVQDKGAILTAMNVFWRKIVLDPSMQDLVASGSGIDAYLPKALQGDPELQKRALVVKKLEMLLFEAIVRGYLTGSGLKAYRDTGKVCGHRLPEGLQDGSRLPCGTIFTPTTKAEIGHDEHVDVGSIALEYGGDLEYLSLQVYALAREIALSRGIIIADTKFEWGRDSNGRLRLGDEVITPDSSRLWDVKDWERAMHEGRTPQPFDKQYARDWGKGHGVHERDPANPKDVAYVHGLEVPAEVLEQTTRLYRHIFWRLTGQKLEAFQRNQMGIDTQLPTIHLDIILGSESDLGQAMPALEYLKTLEERGLVALFLHVISCHRNPEALRKYAEKPDADVIVAAAGKAAALPGVLAAWLRHFGNHHIPVIGVALEGKTGEANQAARFSITQLPDQPVLLDKNDQPFFGAEGLRDACEMVVTNEFLPAAAGPTKEAKFCLDIRELLRN